MSAAKPAQKMSNEGDTEVAGSLRSVRPGSSTAAGVVTVVAAALAATNPDTLATAARARYGCYPWWLSDDPYVLTSHQLREPLLLIPFPILVEAVSLVLGRDVAPCEFLDCDLLLKEYKTLMRRA